MEFIKYIDENIAIFDGAMGTMIQKKGLKLGEVPETLNIAERDTIIEIHKEYIEAGAKVITANTFGANELKLEKTGYSVEKIIDAGIKLAREAACGKDVFVALDMGPVGELVEPMGTLSFDKAYEIYKRQVVQGVKSGADLILIETMTDLYELKAAVLAVKENSPLPVIATMSFEKDHRTFTGCLPSSMAITLDGLGVDGLGINCSLGPNEIYPIVEELVKWTDVPILVQANAGLPIVRNNEACYDVSADQFAEYAMKFVQLGVRMVGGCCGTNPEYIKKIKNNLSNIKPVILEKKNFSALCSPNNTVLIEGVKVIGERINPTGKKLFKEALKNNDIDYILKQGISQVEAGAHILDVNVGLPEINEPEMMVNVIKKLQSVINVPLQIDSSDACAVEKGLRYCNGKPIVNSVNGEDKVLDKILPLVKKYGAAVVGLTLDDHGIPNNAFDRLKIAEKIVKKAESYGIKRQDVYIDTLTLTCSAQQKEVVETVKALMLVKEKLKAKTVLGVSNISFGLPRRELINETFLSIAMSAGLDLPIINPNDKSMMDKISAFNVLYNYDQGAKTYIEKYASEKTESKDINNKNVNLADNTDLKAVKKSEKEFTLVDMVIMGLKDDAKNSVTELIKTHDELEIVNNYLIPALDIVGDEYEKGIIFLPQLIQSAETVKCAFDVLKESLKNKELSGITKGKIILATVKGDVHDIGKNIVKVILENYNYEIIDLGKDVAVERVVEEAKKYKDEPIIVGLSALMTTTMRSMEETINELRKNNINCTVMVGGAVLTVDYASKIGADFYAKDAKEAVEIAKKVFNK